jgi:hypothetical protein
VVAAVPGHFLVDVDHHQRANGVGGRNVADGGPHFLPVGGRVQLRPVLIGGQFVGRGHEAVLFILELLADIDVALDLVSRRGRLEGGLAESRPHRLNRFEGVGQVDVLGIHENLLVHPPQAFRRIAGRC